MQGVDSSRGHLNSAMGALSWTSDVHRRVLVFDGASDLALMRTLSLWDYRAESGWASGSADAGNLDKPIAAIVTDAAHEPIALCRTLSPSCPVILLADDASFSMRLAAAEAGISAFVRRPLDPIELSEWLEQFAIQRAPEILSVLIVDDDWLTAELNAEVLRASGMIIQIVTEPSQTLKAIEDTPPDLILMDMQMPGVDGVQLAQIIRQSRRLLSLPIIFLSAERDEARQLHARQLGGDDFIIKPVSPERLISLVKLRAERSKSLRSLMERDRLTGLYDHGRFKERLFQELERCRRTGGELSLIMLDIDHFKQVNDRFGHPTGDSVLRALSSVLRAGLRHIDVIGRYGGEEFGIILLDTDQRSGANVADRLREHFSTLPLASDAGAFLATFSAGVASSRDHASATALVGAADRALYEAKRGGRNRVEISARGGSTAVKLDSLVTEGALIA